MRKEQKSRLKIEKCKYQEDTKTACNALCKYNKILILMKFHELAQSCQSPWSVQISQNAVWKKNFNLQIAQLIKIYNYDFIFQAQKFEGFRG